jgi:hypothetical protein
VQVSVRLPAGLVRYMDGVIAAGEVAGRGEWLEQGAELARRRREAEHDAAIYAAEKASGGIDPGDMAALAKWGSENAERLWSDLD